MKRYLFLFILLLPHGAQAETLRLDQVISRVKQYHPSIKQARFDAESSRQAKYAQSWLEDPQLGLTFQEVALDNKSLGNADMTNYSVSQKIPFPTSLVTKSKSLNAEFKAKKQLVSSAERAQVLDAKKTYFELIANQKQLSAKETALGNYRQMAKSLEATYKTQAQSVPNSQPPSAEMGSIGDDNMIGGSGLSDLFMVKMKQAELESEIHDLHHQYHSLTAHLNLIMGRDPDADLNLITPTLKILKLDEQTLEKKVLAQNSDLQALSWLVQKSKKETSLAKQTLIPNLTPEFAYNQRQNRENAYTMSFHINFPLWLNRNAAQIKEAKASEYKMAAELDAQKLNLKSDLYYLWNHAKWHVQILQKYQDEILPLSQSMVNTALSEYQLHQGNQLGLLQKLISYQETQGMYWDMWRDYQTEYALLEQLVGEEL